MFAIVLIKKYPEASKKKNEKGELCLHIALKSGKTWDTGIKKLLKAEPRAIKIKDKSVGLYPFMLAAVGNTVMSKEEKRLFATSRARSKYTKSCWNEFDEDYQREEIDNILMKDKVMELDTVYRLLLAAPTLVKSAIPKQDSETRYLLNDNKILRQKLKDLSTKVSDMRRKENLEKKDYEKKVRFEDEELKYPFAEYSEPEPEIEEDISEVESYLIRDMLEGKEEKSKKTEKFKKFYMSRARRFFRFLKFGKKKQKNKYYT
mmetsp:Transcript_13016/g.28730  ORF Transcript_13016/g.28730 Transcript_13016/m.28730 type:complete len:261 (-) Transcript_13016:90-872(-)